MAVSINSVKTNQVAQKSRKILELLKEIKELTGAYGLSNDCIDIARPRLMVEPKELCQMDTVKMVRDLDCPDFACEVFSVIEGVKYFCLATVGQMKIIFPDDWAEYCKINNLCNQCGAENVENDEYRNCPNNCWGEYKA
ncbi:MAG: hypothetical protein ACYDG6_11375 [Thermincolia bacterium]